MRVKNASPRFISEFKLTSTQTSGEMGEEEGENDPRALDATKSLISGTLGEPTNQLSIVGSDFTKSENKGKSGYINQETHSSSDVISGGLDASVLGILKTVISIRDLSNGSKDWKSVLEFIATETSTLSTMVSGTGKLISGAYRLHEGVEEGKGWMKQLGGWAESIASSIDAVKGLVLMIYNAIKKGKSKSTDRGREAISAIAAVLESAKAGVNAAKNIVDIFGGPAQAVATAVPAIGIAINAAMFILGIMNVVRGKTGERTAKREQHEQGKAETVSFADNKLIKEVNTKVGAANTAPPAPTDFYAVPNGTDNERLFHVEVRGTRSWATAFRKGDYFRVNQKVMFAVTNKNRLDRGQSDPIAPSTVIERSKEYLSSDYYVQVDGTDKELCLWVRIGASWVRFDAAAQTAIRQYEFISKAQEIGKERAVLGGEDITTAVVNIVGEVLTLAGPAAMAGAIVKGTMTAINAGFSFARFLSQQYENYRGKKIHADIAFAGKISGVDESTTQKQREYIAHADYIMDMITKLPDNQAIVAARGDANQKKAILGQYQSVKKYLDLTGVNIGLFYAQAGHPVKQRDMIAKALGGR